MNYGVVIPARNEEQTIEQTIGSLLYQTHPPTDIVVINDGSTDQTVRRAKVYPQVVVYSLPPSASKLGQPALACIFNIGFRYLQSKSLDAVFVSGADAIYPAKYCATLLEALTQQVGMVSGHPVGENIRTSHVGGGGRMINTQFFKKIGFKYPVIHGWESAPIYACWLLGYRAFSFSTLTFTNQRAGGTHFKSYVSWGKGMRANGYWWTYAWMRAIRFVREHGYKQAIQLLAGYYSANILHTHPQLKKYVRKYQIHATRTSIRTRI